MTALPQGHFRRDALLGLLEQTTYADKQHYTCEAKEPQPTKPRGQWLARGRATKTS